MVSNGMNNKRISNKKIQSTKRININNNTIQVNSSKCNKLNGNTISSNENTTRTIKYRIPEYVNFIKIREKQISNSIGHENKIKSNGKSVENKKENKNGVVKNKSKKNKKENINENFIVCSSVRNFNNHCCFNLKHRRDYENCSTKKKENKSVSKRYCNCDKNKNNKEIICIKSNGKKIGISNEKIQKYQNNETYRSYLSIYEKDKKLKLNKEKSKNKCHKNVNKITYLYQKDSKKCDYTYRRVLFKINS